eukprot:CAMPEP_0185570012 /NCGR_PEP_ID=MMETSP0434-20130131/2466_1 /TAXON_ID=626734 ORGANISM="Favella taraikaensis, Strain Fe Narragansett Bay" /NCGR_SAMPLE_ID=MMETSP0434 /ASSEMBLY_ACC=CAM_ASM_000379 /LENGTH=137 /DNA_ID=CAMNT_0028185003 /DNA_START=122 /DNA_END=537 /DNA_ORIENTATION=+
MICAADEFFARAAPVLMIVAATHTEGDQAAAEDAPNDRQHEAEDPGERASCLIDVGLRLDAAQVADDVDGDRRPVAFGVSRAVLVLHLLDNYHCLRLAVSYGGSRRRHRVALTDWHLLLVGWGAMYPCIGIYCMGAY